ncbi:MAG: alpha/beta fold hydrolase [Rhodanobacteraceae bacterium]|nr:MAG: alpha/beta fold hydrolase [Rhodanobacteraceae bacterium]
MAGSIDALSQQPPPVMYVRAAHGDIAYRVAGDGPATLLLLNPMSRSVETLWDYPPWSAMLARLARTHRLIVFDRRGAGVSDPLPSDVPPTWEDWLEDIVTVLDHLSVAEVALLAERDAAAASMLFAASHPERVRALVLGNTSARFRAAPGYPCGESAERSDQLSAQWDRAWGTADMVAQTRQLLTSDPDYVRWVMRMQRVSYSPRRAGAEFRYIINFDARSVLASIRAPTLILHRRDLAVIPLAHARYLAAHVAGARLRVLPGSDMDVLVPGDEDTLARIETFLAGLGPVAHTTRALTTVLCLGIAQAEQLATSFGDARWQDLLVRHRAIVRAELGRFQGREADCSRDRFQISFDGPARALRFARTVRQALRDQLRFEIRVGVHAGECVRAGDALGGPAVEVGAAVLAAAQPGEVLATAAVRDLGAGSGIEFREIRTQSLTGVAGDWVLYAIEG